MTKDERTAREAAALRANLLKRKVRTRALEAQGKARGTERERPAEEAACRTEREA